MYTSDLNTRDRGGAITAVVAIHAALLFALLNATGHIDLTDPQNPIRVFDVTDPPPPPPEPIQQQERQQERPREEEGAASPENIRSQATPIVDPQPRISLPLPVPMATTETPNEGVQPTQGASDRPGPGTGAGGTGTGTGSGGAGSGTGGGGGGGIATRAQLLTPSLRSRDFPRQFRRLLAQGRSPFVMFTVLPNGRVTNCRIYQSSGDPELDAMTCALVTSRFVYRPAYNRRGEPVASEMAYRQAR